MASSASPSGMSQCQPLMRGIEKSLGLTTVSKLPVLLILNVRRQGEKYPIHKDTRLEMRPQLRFAYGLPQSASMLNCSWSLQFSGGTNRFSFVQSSNTSSERV